MHAALDRMAAVRSERVEEDGFDAVIVLVERGGGAAAQRAIADLFGKPHEDSISESVPDYVPDWMNQPFRALPPGKFEFQPPPLPLTAPLWLFGNGRLCCKECWPYHNNEMIVGVADAGACSFCGATYP